MMGWLGATVLVDVPWATRRWVEDAAAGNLPSLLGCHSHLVAVCPHMLSRLGNPGSCFEHAGTRRTC
jgi:hypothetical protein